MRTLKILLVFIIVLGFALSLAACGSNTASENKNADNKNIAVAGVVFQEDQFMKLLAKGYEAAAKEAGVTYLAGNTGNDQAKEAELINTYMSQKVAGIAIAPLNSQSSVEALAKADQAGIKVAVTNINLSNAPFIVGGYTSDGIQLGLPSGKVAHDFIQNKLGGKAKIAILQLKSQVPEESAKRVNGFKEQLKDLPGVEYVADQDAWLQDVAIAKTSDILTAHPDVNIIFAVNDGGTIGATMGVKNAGLAGKCFVFGIDIGEQQLNMLKDPDNILQAVTGQDPFAMGYNAMKDLIAGIKNGNAPNKGKTSIISGVLLTRDNPAAIDKFAADLKAKMSQ